MTSKFYLGKNYLLQLEQLSHSICTNFGININQLFKDIYSNFDNKRHLKYQVSLFMCLCLSCDLYRVTPSSCDITHEACTHDYSRLGSSKLNRNQLNYKTCRSDVSSQNIYAINESFFYSVCDRNIQADRFAVKLTHQTLNINHSTPPQKCLREILRDFPICVNSIILQI